MDALTAFLSWADETERLCIACKCELHASVGVARAPTQESSPSRGGRSCHLQVRQAEVTADRNTARQSQGSGRSCVCGISDRSWDTDQDVNLDLEVSLFGAW